MKVSIKYETHGDCNGNVWTPVVVLETRTIDDDCYPRVIGRLIREIHDKGFTMLDIRCLDAHPKDLTGCFDNKEILP